MYCTIELVLIIEKMLLRIPEQMSSSLCWRRCRWMWCRTTGSRILRDSEETDREGNKAKMTKRMLWVKTRLLVDKKKTKLNPSCYSYLEKRRAGSQLYEQLTAVWRHPWTGRCPLCWACSPVCPWHIQLPPERWTSAAAHQRCQGSCLTALPERGKRGQREKLLVAQKQKTRFFMNILNNTSQDLKIILNIQKNYKT